MRSRSISVMLVDDHAVVREGYRRLLEKHEGITVVAEAADAAGAYQAYKNKLPDVVVMDFNMPTLNGLDAAKEILRELPAMRVIILTTYADQGDVREGLSIGIRGFAPKTGKAEDVLRAISQVLAGQTYIGPGF